MSTIGGSSVEISKINTPNKYSIEDDFMKHNKYGSIKTSSEVQHGAKLDNYPDKLLEFLGKSCIFKVLVKLQNINYFQPCVIMVSKISKDEALIGSFSSEHQIDMVSKLNLKPMNNILNFTVLMNA
ncbi:hypothetical protein PIB30_029465 [Stylosanthes scabra]|uniref:Uncharacterized protein n=1 Tax=Stylosanthes scabra TaxID=79078 RepID=A0ABU6Z850_9FABA|nr:hypothetical protein [Stylosanthes scabra]